MRATTLGQYLLYGKDRDFLAVTSDGAVARATEPSTDAEWRVDDAEGGNFTIFSLSGGTTTLKPRGYHLLLQDVKASLAKGSVLPVTLTFEKAGAVSVEFAVEEPGPIGKAILHEEHHRS